MEINKILLIESKGTGYGGSTRSAAQIARCLHTIEKEVLVLYATESFHWIELDKIGIKIIKLKGFNYRYNTIHHIKNRIAKSLQRRIPIISVIIEYLINRKNIAQIQK